MTENVLNDCENSEKKEHYFYIHANSDDNTSHWTTLHSDDKNLNLSDINFLIRTMLKQAQTFRPSVTSVNITNIVYLGYMTEKEWESDPYKENKKD